MNDELYITDLISVEILQKLQDSFSNMTGMAALTTDKTGFAVTKGSNFTDFCMNYTRKSDVGNKRCMGCDKAGAELTMRSGKACTYYCHAGLVDYAAPIIVNGKMIGSFIGGQVLPDKPNYDRFRETALELGIDPEKYVEAVKKVQIIDKAVIDKSAKFLAEVASTLSFLAYQSHEIKKRNKEIAKASSMKSDFLANMSHEIRTPMNAVIGLVDLALREDMSPAAKSYIRQIKSSAKNLLVIINDILDFSKIESGKFDIINVAYEPLSVVNDLASIANSRIGNKDIEFTMDVSPDMPQTIFGDNVRIHQIILNILTNAVKFTQSGEVHLSLECIPDENGETVTMKVAVSDTGMGIKTQDMHKLFNSFQQVDSKRNRNIEGTGLGLAISKQLLSLMDGKISVDSTYGKGSTFFFELPQKIIDKSPSIPCIDKELSVGILIGNEFVKKQLIKDLERIKADYRSLDDLKNSSSLDFDFLIIEKVYYSQSIAEILDNNPSMQCIVISKPDALNDISHPRVRIIYKPVYSLNLYNVMGITDISYSEHQNAVDSFTFVAPEAKILIVDDNKINLTVAKGLIEPLNMKVDVAESAAEAIDLVGKMKYDLIFMDHMMPEVDGVECTHIIRRVLPGYNDVPIIALTANAVGGAKEMFLKEGMNDFVAKPIEVKDIVSKLRKWLPQDKIMPADKKCSDETAEKTNKKSLDIEGLDTKSALTLIGNEELFFTILKEYYTSIDKKANTIIAHQKAERWRDYTIEVHSLKSTSKQIGANKVSALAAELERAGNEGNYSLINEKTGEMISEFQRYKEILAPVFPDVQISAEVKTANNGEIKSLLDEMKEALDNFDTLQIDDVIEKMSGYKYPETQTGYFEKLKQAAEISDLDECLKIVDEWNALLML